ncbi:MAG: hypothetical protein JWN45_3389 [Acidobacteriaceae bacterium]|nr:hypothetical protein [Acidobacteriaceae bacterium]
MDATQSSRNSTFAALRQFVRPRSAVERCEMCSLELREEHQHLFDPAKRELICACDACSLLFPGQGATKYLRVPRRGASLPDFRMSEEQWADLMIPINLAFFSFHSAAARVVVMYPSPAGATESLLNLDRWQDIVRENPILEKMEPDVEALLLNRVTEPHRYFLVPIDECYKLVGLIRTNWRGLSGGTEVWKAIEDFFAGLAERSSIRTERLRA